MSPHTCPFTLGQLMALYAIAQVAGSTELAATVLAHAHQHESEES